MKPYYRKRGVTIYHGDCREVLPELPKVDMVFMDPPFGHNNNNGDLIHRREAALGRGPAGTGETVLDPFAGHGPTLLAARNLGRKAIGIEIEERHCEMAALRLEASITKVA